MTILDDRRAIWAWFNDRGVEIAVAEFIADWSDRLTAGQGIGDLRWLTTHGHLVKRVDYNNHVSRGRPRVYYTAVGDGP